MNSTIYRILALVGVLTAVAACSSGGFDAPTVRVGLGGPPVTPTPTPTPPGTASFSFVTAGNTVTEGAGGSISVAISGTPASFPVTVNYSVAVGATASAADYTLASGTLTFNSVANQNIAFTTTDDADFEATETLTVVLSNPSTGMTIGSGSFTLTINDNDLPTKCGTTIDVTWIAPTKNTDGSDLTNLAGFKIHYGGAPKTYSTEVDLTNPAETSFTIVGLPPGDYYLAMRAYNSNNVHSDYTGDVMIRLANCTSTAKVGFWMPLGHGVEYGDSAEEVTAPAPDQSAKQATPSAEATEAGASVPETNN